MPRRFSLNCIVDLPSDNVFEHVEVIAKMKAPWDSMLRDLESSGLKVEHSQEYVEVRAKMAPRVNGAKRGRKPRTQQASTPSTVDLDAV